MAMPIPARVWTRDDVLALPDDGNRYELVDGELLVSPAPRGRHQRGVWQLHLIVAPFVEKHRLGTTGMAPADLDLKTGQLLQPDLFVAGMVAGKEPVDWPDYPVPLLVVEVLSPSTARYDRVTKRRRYQRSQVHQYWIVDLDARVIERWGPTDARPELITGSITWEPAPGGPALTIDLDAYFAKVWV